VDAEDEARRLQAVLDAIPAPIFFKDLRSAYVGCNVAFERYVGISRAELVGKTVFDIAPPDLARAYRAADDALFAAGGAQIYESRVQWADGSRRDVIFHKAPIRDETGRVTGIAGAMLDVTEQRAAERSLEQARDRLARAQQLAAVGTLAAGVAHELTNPLTFVLSNVEDAAAQLGRLRGAPPDADGWDEALQALDDALEGAERMRVIVRDLRTMAHADGAPSGAVDVRKVLEYAANLAWNEVRTRARLTWELGDVPPVRGSEGRLGQVLVNLLVNAAHAIPEGDPGAHLIRLATARRTDGKVAISVTDTGAGIPPEHLPRIFDPFFTTKPVGLGTGLGLWVCHTIVTALDGALEVSSEVGRGTTFRVILPAADAGEARQAARPDRHGDRPRRRLLVVDDEPLGAAAVRRQLASDFVVDAASGPADALARVAAHRYDAVVCDLAVGGRSGLELVEALRREAPALSRRVLVVAGGGAAPSEELLAAAGVAWLAKPLDGRRLRRALRELLATPT
jgi:PAS domain S-box-containing protein